MKRFWVMTVVIMLTTACARLPEIQLPVGFEPLPSHVRCRELFPQGRWQMHHAIEAKVPGGSKSVLTGVTVLSSVDGTIESALMTVEGFVLFSGRFDGVLTVHRAVTPFDRPGFAQGLMDDLRLLFLAPQVPLCRTGSMDGHDRICRYCLPEATVDIRVRGNETRQIRQYDADDRIRRTLEIDAPVLVADTPFARKMVLERHGLLGYQLNLTLLEALPLDREEPGRKTP